MQYALLIYSDEKNLPDDWPEAERDEFYAGYRELNRDLEEKKVIVAAQRLQTTDTATTVREVGGKQITTDGPFAETKEALAGFYLVDCADLDEALAYARRIPGVRIGSVEVRPLYQYGG